MSAVPHLTAELFEIPGNPVPDDGVSGVLTIPGSISIRYAHWKSGVVPSRGTILLAHGRTECIEKYFETIGDLQRLGFGVATFDWRGQGGSTRLLSDPLKGHVEHFNQYLDDLDAVLTRVVLPDCKPPFYLLGHSTGGLVSLLAAPAVSNRINRVVLMSPMLKLDDLPIRQRYLKHVLGLLTYTGFGRSYVPFTHGNIEKRDLDNNKLTSDWNRYKRGTELAKHHWQLAVSGPTISWLHSAFRASEHIGQPGFASAISIPTLFILAGNDSVVSTSFSERYAQRMRAASFLTIAGARHEIFQEADVYREQALAAIDAFLPNADGI
ncbi:MAG: alpha/beta fold hydrolase [Rhizobiaceae bacterium]